MSLIALEVVPLFLIPLEASRLVSLVLCMVYPVSLALQALVLLLREQAVSLGVVLQVVVASGVDLLENRAILP